VQQNSTAKDWTVMQAVIDSTPDVIFDKDLVGVYRASDNAWGWLVVGTHFKTRFSSSASREPASARRPSITEA